MRLLKLRLKNFRRFAGDHSFDVDESLVAIIGPNEAGKSSLLAALEQVGSHTHPGSSDRTRGQEDPAVVRALYQIEAEDRQGLDAPWADELRLVWVSRGSNSTTTTWSFEPSPVRDLRVRVAALTELQDFLRALVDEQPEGWNEELALDVQSHLSSEEETLEEKSVEDLKLFRRHLDEVADANETDTESGSAGSLTKLRTIDVLLNELIEHESQPTPWRIAVNHLRRRLPGVSSFRDTDRVLHSDYLLEDLVGEAGDLPRALANLTGMAGIDILQVAELLEEGRRPEVERIFELGNDRLENQFEAVWTQSGVYPRLTAPLDGHIRIMIRTEDSAGYSEPEERSDGLRWFLALVAFLATRGSDSPILTVDEAETHLHYDAQADLIDALMTQRLTAQVVYTTHSVGCLPPDLGRGIRAVLPRRDHETSAIANSYWSLDTGDELRVGDTPVLFAMGARMLALTIPRFGVVVEGPSDAVLIPTLLRYATSRRILGYRVVPGLSESPQTRLSELDRAAGKVVYLTDGDSGGAALRVRLGEAGVDNNQIFGLDAISEGLTLEDLVPAELFATAVNEVLDRWSITETRIAQDDVPVIGRWGWLENEALDGKSASRLSKVRVAQTLVDSATSRDSALIPQYIEALQDLDRDLCSAMGLVSVGG